MIRHFFFLEMRSAWCTNYHQISVVLTSVFSVFTRIQRAIDGWHPSGVARTRIQVIGVNFNKFLIKGMEI